MLDGKENTHGITTSEKKTYTVDEIAALLNISMKSAYADFMLMFKRAAISSTVYVFFSDVVIPCVFSLPSNIRLRLLSMMVTVKYTSLTL